MNNNTQENWWHGPRWQHLWRRKNFIYSPRYEIMVNNDSKKENFTIEYHGGQHNNEGLGGHFKENKEDSMGKFNYNRDWKKVYEDIYKYPYDNPYYNQNNTSDSNSGIDIDTGDYNLYYNNQNNTSSDSNSKSGIDIDTGDNTNNNIVENFKDNQQNNISNIFLYIFIFIILLFILFYFIPK